MSAKTTARSSIFQPLMFFVGVTVFVVLSSLLLLPSNRPSLPLHPDNYGDDGTAALVTLLRNQGVNVQVENSLAKVEAAATADTTVVVVNTANLEEEDREIIGALPATLVLGFNSYDYVGGFTDRVETSAELAPDYVTAQCNDPDALAAARLSHGWATVMDLSEDQSVEICFPSENDPTSGVLAVWEERGAKRYAVGETELFTNEYLAKDGNAALTMRLLGKHDTLIWYTALGEDSSAAIVFAPSWYRAFMWLGCVLIGALIWWRAPRFGPVATEALPVVVKGGEIVRGVGRLYYHHRTADHAAAALRAGTLMRLRQQLGLSAHMDDNATISAIAAHVNYSEQSLHQLLGGPAPTTAAQLTDLASDLAALEREAHLL